MTAWETLHRMIRPESFLADSPLKYNISSHFVCDALSVNYLLNSLAKGRVCVERVLKLQKYENKWPIGTVHFLEQASDELEWQLWHFPNKWEFGTPHSFPVVMTVSCKLEIKFKIVDIPSQFWWRISEKTQQSKKSVVTILFFSVLARLLNGKHLTEGKHTFLV